MWNVTPKREMKDMCGVAGLGWCWWLVSCFVMNWVTQTQLSVNNVKLQRASPSPRLFISKSNIIPVVYSAAASNSNNFIYPILHLHISV